MTMLVGAAVAGGGNGWVADGCNTIGVWVATTIGVPAAARVNCAATVWAAAVYTRPGWFAWVPGWLWRLQALKNPNASTKLNASSVMFLFEFIILPPSYNTKPG